MILSKKNVTISAPTITSYGTIRAGFPPIPFIATSDNPPNLNCLLLCTDHLGECTQSHPHRLHTFGHRYLALTDVIWALESVDAHPVRQTNPSANVTHIATNNTVERINAESPFGMKYMDSGDERTMDHALVNRLYEIVGPFANDLKDEARSIRTPTFLQIKALAAIEWRHSTPAERNANLETISAKWHPSEGVKRLFQRARGAIA